MISFSAQIAQKGQAKQQGIGQEKIQGHKPIVDGVIVSVGVDGAIENGDLHVA
ncbi:MAG: hypothetical protein JRD88_00550 [Deltaproteobacteria bacterium]|nr:hypothetical protein [Deltaproteobacteria bacterium]